MTGPRVWLGGGCPPQHLLAVGSSIPGGGCLVVSSFLLHPVDVEAQAGDVAPANLKV